MATLNLDPQQHRTSNWRAYLAGVALLLFVIAAPLVFGTLFMEVSPSLFGSSSDTVSGAAILGVSIVFAGIVTVFIALHISRINAFSGMMDDVMETRRQIERGNRFAAEIEQIRKQSPSASG